MATVDRHRNDADNNSLSSEKRKVQSIRYAERIKNKRFKVRSGSYTNVSDFRSDRIHKAADTEDNKESVQLTQDRKAHVPVGHESKYYAEARQNTVNSTSITENYPRSDENNPLIEEHRTISPETADRMKRQAFATQLFDKSEEKKTAEMRKQNKEPTEPEYHSIEDRKTISSEVAEHHSVEDRKTISPETADKMKRQSFAQTMIAANEAIEKRKQRAAMLAEQNSEEIKLSAVRTVSDEKSNDVSDNKKDEISDYGSQKDDSTDKLSEKAVSDRKTDTEKTQYISDEQKKQIAKGEFVNRLKERMDSRTSSESDDGNTDNRNYINSYNPIIDSNYEIVPKWGHIPESRSQTDIGLQSAVNEASQVSNSAHGESLGASAVNVASTLAMIEAKKIAQKIARGESDDPEKIARFVKEHKEQSLSKYVDTNKDRSRVTYEIEAKEKANQEELTREERRKYLHRKRISEKMTEFLEKRREDAKKNTQKGIFLDSQRKSSTSNSIFKNRESKVYTKKKGGVIAAAGGGFVLICGMVILLPIMVVVANFFGWTSSMTYNLVGEDDEFTAETTADVMKGYTKMIANYFDVAQAQLKYELSEWSGGQYNWEDATLDFNEFYQDYVSEKTELIRSQYMPYIQMANTPQEANYYIQMLNNALSQFMMNARNEALSAYTELVGNLTDEYYPMESTPPHEFAVGYGADEINDIVQFNGKPIVGTNFFGNMDIQSDLKVEEILAYVALYKSLMQIELSNTGHSDEIIPNITPDDISTFFKDTEYIQIEVNITENHKCNDEMCKRTLVNSDSGQNWDYYCDMDHQNLHGEVKECLSKDDLIEKILELTNADTNGVKKKDAEDMVKEYLKTLDSELGITDSDYTDICSDSTKTDSFLEELRRNNGEISGNFWEIPSPFEEGEDDE